jgi:hypothetical protein
MNKSSQIFKKTQAPASDRLYTSIPAIIILAMFFVVIQAGCTASKKTNPTGNTLTLISKYDGAELYISDQSKFYVLNLKGDFTRMGRQKGHLLRDILAQYYAEVYADLDARGVDHEKWLAAGNQ